VSDPGGSYSSAVETQGSRATALHHYTLRSKISADPLLARKIGITLLPRSDLFVITVAIIRFVLTLGSNPSTLNINCWYELSLPPH
jgi:hypothetical protein